jgi:hypothetical protein
MYTKRRQSWFQLAGVGHLRFSKRWREKKMEGKVEKGGKFAGTKMMGIVNTICMYFEGKFFVSYDEETNFCNMAL